VVPFAQYFPEIAMRDVIARNFLLSIVLFLCVGLQSIAASAESKESKDDCRTRCGYIDVHGKFVIEPKFLVAMSFSEGIAWAQSVASAQISSQRFDAIDPGGRILFSVDAIAVDEFKNGLARVIQQDKDAYVDHTGKFVAAPIVQEPRKEGIQPFGKAMPDGKSLIYQPQTSFVIHQQWEHFSDGLCQISYTTPDEQSHAGFMDSTQHIVLQLPKNIIGCGDFYEGLAAVLIESADSGAKQKLGVMNHKGEVVIAPVCELPLELISVDRMQFHDRVALVQIQGVDYYMNTEGKIIAHFQGGFCRSFSGGLAAVGVLVDAKGNRVESSDASMRK
jgi:hypothetical protein